MRMSGLMNKKALFALLIALFLVVSVGGVFALCTMSPMGHLSHWQQTFTTTVQQVASIALLLLLMVAVAGRLPHDALLFRQTGLYLPHYRGGGRVFDPLRLAFARGILNTKAF